MRQALIDAALLLGFLVSVGVAGIAANYLRTGKVPAITWREIDP